MSETLRTQDLVKAYRGRRVVDGISIEVASGEIVGLLGQNGAGKTTTFYMIMGLVRPASGSIFLGDVNVTDLPMHVRARMGVGYLSQEPSIFRKLTAEDNIRAILETLGLSRAELESRLTTLAADLGIDHLRKSRAYMLSGGERRRLEIARALVTSPRFMLLDEPFSGIDPIAVQDIQSIIRKLKDKGLGLLITDHNVRETLSITDRSYIVAEGKILVSGKSEDLANDPIAREAYLGERFSLH
ncbi:MAG TPA: LPS export ABC transporter ATP-binding protein [bacterium]|nr:LPS export ABC transporter ATP-binding protein [bacterium]